MGAYLNRHGGGKNYLFVIWKKDLQSRWNGFVWEKKRILHQKKVKKKGLSHIENGDNPFEFCESFLVHSAA